MNTRFWTLAGAWVLGLGCALATPMAGAQDRLINVPTREGQTIGYWWMPKPGATATVLLLSGGSGGIGLRDGQPQSGNFLIRSREHFRAEGFHVALLGNPSDKRALDDAWRTSAAHQADVLAVLQSLRDQGASQPVWLVGTSRGTVSATALGLALQEQLAGLVLTASVASFSVSTAVTQQALDRLRLPVLVYHHRDDACRITLARDAEHIVRRLTQAPVRKFWLVTGGANPTGDPCEAFHWHGFVGMEAQAVKDMADWMRQPTP